MNAKDIITICISGAALLTSIIFAMLNRRYARSLFEATGYPDLFLSIEIRNAWHTFRILKQEFGEKYQDDMSSQPNYSWVHVKWRNKTKIEALDLHAFTILTRGVRRVRWRELHPEWVSIPPGGLGEASVGDALNLAMSILSPNDIHFRTMEPGGPFDGWLELIHSQKRPRFGLYVELRWRPPLWRARLLKKRFAWSLKPHSEEGGIVDSYEVKEIKFPFRFIRWRPKSYKLPPTGPKVGVEY